MNATEEANEIADPGYKMLSRIETIQKLLVVDKFLEILDSNISNKLYAMRDLGVPQSESFYQEAEAFFKECFKMALDDYFRKVRFD